MIDDLDESLRELVRRDVLNGTKVDVSFDAPTREWASRRQGPTLDLYLYDIREDIQRRRVQYEEGRGDDGRVVSREVPARLFKLSYLVTAWTQRAEDEHRLLSAALACFLSADSLPRDVLRGRVAELSEPVRTTIGLPLPQDRSISDVWTALGGELKPSLDLIVGLPFPARSPRAFEIGPPVLEEPRLDFTRPDADAETAPRRSRPTASEGRDTPSEEALIEQVRGGKPGSDGGRRLTVRTMPPRR